MSNLSDVISNANIIYGFSYFYVTDRFGNPNSAIYLNKGYLQVPSGVYFEGDFTITAWIQLKSYNSLSTIIDFGNSVSNDNIILGVSLISPDNLIGEIYAFDKPSTIKSFGSINLNEWYHVALSLKANRLSIYINGKLDKSETIIYLPRAVNRIGSYIGKSNWKNVSYADAVYNDIKIYRGALTSDEIYKEYDELKSETNYFTKSSKYYILFRK